MNTMNDIDVTPILVPVDVAAKMIGRGITFIYHKIADGTLHAVKSDKRTLIVVESLKDYVASLPRAKIEMAPRRRITVRSEATA